MPYYPERKPEPSGEKQRNTIAAEKNGITILRHCIDRAYSAKTDKDGRNATKSP